MPGVKLLSSAIPGSESWRKKMGSASTLVALSARGLNIHGNPRETESFTTTKRSAMMPKKGIRVDPEAVSRGMPKGNMSRPRTP